MNFYYLCFNMYKWIKRNLVWIIKWFLWLLLLQFFLQTFVTFVLGLDGSFWTIIWMWKEFLIIWLTTFVVWYFVRKLDKAKIEKMWNEFPLKTFVFIFFLTLLVAFVLSFFQSSISNFVLSARYSMFGFFLFLLFYIISYLFFDDKSKKIIEWYNKIIKWILVLALWWWAAIWIIPWVVENLGYNQWNFEWDIWVRPPVAYYTQFKDGFVRNQFLFERPISLWFFLVAFWPLFFISILYRKWPKKWIFRWGLYGLILLSTFSRAAWWAWFVQTIVMFLILYGKNWKKLALYFFVPLLLLWWVVTYYGKDQIINRQYSNTGHVKEIKLALQKVSESPFFGKWAASAGPASHHLWEWKEYNPENQYLQIWIEYWLIAFAGWMFLYVYLHLIGFWAWKSSNLVKENKDIKKLSLIMIAFSLGLFGLSIEWMVLHSFVDRMIVYPFMTLFGICYAIYFKEKNHLGLRW